MMLSRVPVSWFSLLVLVSIYVPHMMLVRIPDRLPVWFIATSLAAEVVALTSPRLRCLGYR
jgi:hypothetical protein